jgi:hypothetical protein
MKASPLGATARAKLVQMRGELIAQLDRGIDGGSLALLFSLQLAIDAIDDTAPADGTELSLMPVSERAYAEIFENLRQPGYDHVLVGENGEI